MDSEKIITLKQYDKALELLPDANKCDSKFIFIYVPIDDFECNEPFDVNKKITMLRIEFKNIYNPDTRTNFWVTKDRYKIVE